jgi:hypothetical protein
MQNEHARAYGAFEARYAAGQSALVTRYCITTGSSANLPAVACTRARGYLTNAGVVLLSNFITARLLELSDRCARSSSRRASSWHQRQQRRAVIAMNIRTAFLLAAVTGDRLLIQNNPHILSKCTEFSPSITEVSGDGERSRCVR